MSSITDGPPPWLSMADATIIYQYGERIVYQIGDDYILKRTPRGPNTEAETHHFVALRTEIPVPRIYGEWLSPNRRHHFLLQQKIPGTTLGAAWPRLSKPDKLRLARQVDAMMARLGRFEDTRMQTIAETRLPNNAFVPHPADPPGLPYLSGRWRTDAAIFDNEFLPALSRAGVTAPLIRVLRRTMPPCDTDFVFTHGDLYVGNVMVDPVRVKVTGIIDWESAGFWPEWFQYARITYGVNRDDVEWKRLLSRLQRERGTIKYADQGRVWWDAVATLLGDPESERARLWLRLLVDFLKGNVGVWTLREYRKLR